MNGTAARPGFSVESGKVVAIDADCLWVETVSRSSCGSCHAQKACGHGILAELFSGRRSYLRLAYQADRDGVVAIGDEVSFAVADSLLLRAAAMAYLMPLLSLLAGALLASAFSATDVAAVAGGAAGFVTALLLLRWHARRYRHDPARQPQLLANTSIAPLSPIR